MARRAKRTGSSDTPSVLFGRRVREFRKARGISQAALAAKATMTVGKVSELENGRFGARGPTLERIHQVARALGVEPSQLLEHGEDASHGDL